MLGKVHCWSSQMILPCCQSLLIRCLARTIDRPVWLQYRLYKDNQSSENQHLQQSSYKSGWLSPQKESHFWHSWFVWLIALGDEIVALKKVTWAFIMLENKSNSRSTSPKQGFHFRLDARPNIRFLDITYPVVTTGSSHKIITTITFWSLTSTCLTYTLGSFKMLPKTLASVRRKNGQTPNKTLIKTIQTGQPMTEKSLFSASKWRWEMKISGKDQARIQWSSLQGDRWSWNNTKMTKPKILRQCLK